MSDDQRTLRYDIIWRRWWAAVAAQATGNNILLLLLVMGICNCTRVHLPSARPKIESQIWNYTYNVICRWLSRWLECSCFGLQKKCICWEKYIIYSEVSIWRTSIRQHFLFNEKFLRTMNENHIILFNSIQRNSL